MSTEKPRRISTKAAYRAPARFTKPLIIWLFRKSIIRGSLALQFADEVVQIGSGPHVCTVAPPSLTRFFWMLLKPDYRLPTHYTYGYWCCEPGKLYEFLDFLTAQPNSPLHWWFRLWNRSPVRDQIVYKLFPLKVKENIAKHYNTDPAFMRLILGKHLEYTCAFFSEPEDGLDEAQARKIQKVIERLRISSNDNVLDMGCGWGQIAEAVSKSTNASVTGLNITPNQIAYARNHKTKRTSFLLSDYESFEPTKNFTKIYSIGMLEHIGRGKLGNYFRKISQLLTPEGLALVHCIVRAKEGSTNSWIDREVFPGAYIPELSEVIKAIDRSPLRLETVHSHDRSNYHQTLSAWTQNLYANWDELLEILKIRVPEEDAHLIMRIWEFYLSGSQLVFNESNGYCYNVQIILSCQRHGSLERQSS